MQSIVALNFLRNTELSVDTAETPRINTGEGALVSAFLVLNCFHRYLSYTLNSTIIRKQDATSVITSVASNRAGQKLAWDFVRNHWEYMFTELVSH